MKKLTASVGRYGKYIKYVSFPWPPVVVAHDCMKLVWIQRNILALEEVFLYPGFSYVHTVPFKLCRIRFTIKIAFGMNAINWRSCLYRKPWELHEICQQQKHCIAAGKMLALDQLSLYPGCSYVHQILPFRSNCRRRFPINIAFAVTIRKAQWQTLKH